MFRKEIRVFGEVKEYSVEEIIEKCKYLARKKAYEYSSSSNYCYDFDDLNQCCNIGIWKAYNYYKLPYNFYNVALKFMIYEMLTYIKKMKHLKTEVSFEATVFTSKNGDELKLEDTLGEEDKIIANYAETDIARRLLNALSERQRDELISIHLDEDKKKAIAEKYKISVFKLNERAKATHNRFRMLFIKEDSCEG